jgi:hypothetical protein
MENNVTRDGWLLKSRWMASETRCATHWNKMMAYWNEMTHWNKMDKMEAHKTKMTKRIYCREMAYALKNEGNKLKQIGRKFKQDEIRLSGRVSLQRRMSEGTRLVAQRLRLMGCGRTRKMTLTEWLQNNTPTIEHKKTILFYADGNTS